MTLGRRMHSVAIVAVLATTAASSGCRWIPVRKPDPGASSDRIPDFTRDLPPLPPMHPIGDDEAFQNASRPTPLLDAAASRSAEIGRAMTVPVDPPQEVEPPPPSTLSESAAEAAAPKVDSHVQPAAFRPETPSDTPRADETPMPATTPEKANEAAAEEKPRDVTAEEVEVPVDTPLWHYVLSALAESTLPESAQLSEPPREVTAPTPELEFAISDLRLCRRVLGFGKVEPLDANTVVPGQVVIVYCEIDHIRDEETSAGFRSRLASSIALLPPGGGTPSWKQDLGIVEDVCQRRRRDFFVSYRVTVPSDLPPGRYELSIIQRDLLSGREATRSSTLTIRPR